MMLRFQWDSLRRGDHILVHDIEQPDPGLRPADVTFVDTSPMGHDVAVRCGDGIDAGRLAQPGGCAAHPDPISGAHACWRCAEPRAA